MNCILSALAQVIRNHCKSLNNVSPHEEGAFAHHTVYRSYGTQHQWLLVLHLSPLEGQHERIILNYMDDLMATQGSVMQEQQ